MDLLKKIGLAAKRAARNWFSTFVFQFIEEVCKTVKVPAVRMARDM